MLHRSNKLGSMKNIDFRKNAKKLKKIQKFITPKLLIVETSGWRHLKEKN